MQKTTVLITGSTGFLGSHILEKLMTNENLSIIAACRDKSKLLKNFKGEVRQGDLRDKSYIDRITQGVDVICHTAAWVSLWGHRKEEQINYRDPSLALIDAAVASGVKRFIFDSSVVAVGAHRNNNPVADNEAVSSPGFWPHMDMNADIENYMLKHSKGNTCMIALRCGHFVGTRYNKGLLSLFIPRLKTHMVPWVSGGKARVPIVDGRDVANAFLLAATVDNLKGFESFNICGTAFPTMHEVINFLHSEIGTPRPHFGVPLWGAYVFAWLMEKINPLLPGEPFLTRAIVFLGEDWFAPSDLAKQRLGYEPKIDWQDAIQRQLSEMESRHYQRVSLVDN